MRRVWHAFDFNTFPAIQNICHLLSHLRIYFSRQYCKLYGPRSDCSLRSSLIRVHRVWFRHKSHLVNLIHPLDVLSRQNFQDRIYWQDKIEHTAWYRKGHSEDSMPPDIFYFHAQLFKNVYVDDNMRNEGNMRTRDIFSLLLFSSLVLPHWHGWKFSGLFLNSGFWVWLSIESQPQNAELRRL